MCHCRATTPVSVDILRRSMHSHGIDYDDMLVVYCAVGNLSGCSTGSWTVGLELSYTIAQPVLILYTWTNKILGCGWRDPIIRLSSLMCCFYCEWHLSHLYFPEHSRSLTQPVTAACIGERNKNATDSCAVLRHCGRYTNIEQAIDWANDRWVMQRWLFNGLVVCTPGPECRDFIGLLKSGWARPLSRQSNILPGYCGASRLRNQWNFSRTLNYLAYQMLCYGVIWWRTS